jgi:hypothetical protein
MSISEEELANARVARPMVKAKKRPMSEEERKFLFNENTEPIKEERTVSLAFTEPVTEEVQVQEKPVPKYKEDGEVIVIKDQKKRVRIKYSHTTPEGKTIAFSVGIPAASVEVQQDGVSILISKDIEIRPPALIPCTLEVGNENHPIKEYQVIFAGATHTIGKYINIPFIIVE